ncbi:hypothetical protein BH10ACT1_BH10ACT1_42940 [soil metagenome]
MNQDEFLKWCPRLWHVAPAGAWELIRERGLRTSEQLIQAADLEDGDRARLLTEYRLTEARFVVDGEPVVLRDQERLSARKDTAAILGDDLTLADWVSLLNRRVYLFCDRGPMETHLRKMSAVHGAQDVLVFSPMRLYDTYRSQLELADQSTVAVKRLTGEQKSRATFQPITRFPNKRPKEITVVGGVDDLSVVTRVTQISADGSEKVLHPQVASIPS